ncbi:hypothetical protein N781_12855 [Pontibacillus halophilus JSM 076056 = DSM 19796]|uniref:Uncharacterized protein n=1 Tax=Pontibacillus halophilus JSM 076056 = DSM 19796 TaxID=1385510 RepID=A0A0A5GQ38_9BACI|nr:CAP domain-containing protein [Pontibacillus halophilus]KGX93290.1 hypothetical protein N781_12855 [Pontibacillus halophilus JSM 076056 = DSM 19796]
MKWVRLLLVIWIIILLAFIANEQWNLTDEVKEMSLQVMEDEADPKVEEPTESKVEEPESSNPVVETAPSSTSENSLVSYMGKSVEDMKSVVGEPARVDPTPYGYDWWVYDEEGSYLQVGVQDGKVVSLYTLESRNLIQDLSVGRDYDDLKNSLSFKEEVVVETGGGTYRFQLKEEELKARPLLSISDDVYAQLYFDTYTNELSSIRLLNAETLVKHQPYELYYRGELPQLPSTVPSEWEGIETGVEAQIFDISNAMRTRFGLAELEWFEPVSRVAYGHSKDMALDNYFSHVSPEGDGLQERLKRGEVYYVTAGENIAAQYPDSIAVVEGWLNSEGHRKAMLNDGYTHLGVGVYQYHYTQNFLEKP